MGAHEMPDAGSKTTRPWRAIAEDVSHEQNSNKLSELLQELNRALDEQGIGKPADSLKSDTREESTEANPSRSAVH